MSLPSTPSTTPHSVTARRLSFAGVLLILMVLCSIAVDFFKDIAPTLFPFFYMATGILAWIAAVMLFPLLRRAQKIQICLFLAIGVGLLVFAAMQDVAISVSESLARNASLVSMILSVGFLKLVLLSGDENEQPLPTGRRSFLHTLIAVSVFGSIINISAPILIGDRLTVRRTMDLFTARSIIRVFCACASWSPFFAGMAVVLIAVGDVRVLWLMMGGLPFMLLTTLFVYCKSVYSYPTEVSEFVGYPIQPASLLVPLLLAAAVVIASTLYPSLSILTVIAFSALLLTASLLLLRGGLQQMVQRLVTHVKSGLPQSVNEVLLFLAAGVLASGLVAFVETRDIVLPIAEYTVPVAAGLLALMIVVAALGLHPVIQISALTPLILTTNPDPELLALTFLFSWSLGTMASPLSGTNLVFQGRFGIPAWRGAKQNWSFVAVMFAIAVLILQIFSLLI